MRSVVWIGLGALAVVAAGAGGGCEARPQPQRAPAADVVAVRHDGVVRFADVELPVAPYVMHDPHLDLVVQCQLKRDADLQRGQDSPLCYASERRARDRVKVLRVEILEREDGGRLDMARVMPVLAHHGEGAHVVIERTGTPHQLLDLAHATRRDGELRPDEVRVLCVHPADWRPLVESLEALLPGARRDVVRKLVPGASPAPRPPAPATAP